MKKELLCIMLITCTGFLLHAQEAERKYAFDNYQRYYQDGQRVHDPEKEKALESLRHSLAEHPYRYHSLKTSYSAKECLEQLTDNGIFTPLQTQEDEFRKDNGFQKPYSTVQGEIGLFLTDAFNCIWKIADAYRKKELPLEKALSDKVLKAILHYGNIELGRPNDGPRFHASCFAIPTAAVNIYYAYLAQMEGAEIGQGRALLREVCDMLKALGLQAWTQPLRHDETDENVVSISRFRNHVWWVGGNALAYRSLLPVAAMYRSIPMIDLLAEVCQRGISMTSQNTYSEAFWTEGFTADGAGWGHGKQCLIWGYPIDGTSNALSILNLLKGTPWSKALNRDNAEAILNFLRGGSWYYYKGYRLSCLDRGSYVYNPMEQSIPYAKMLDNIVTNWIDSFTPEEQKELQQLQVEVKKNRINMNNYVLGVYNGTRWFFNNDDLIKKTSDYHITVNMASVRCDGLESAVNMADEYNFYPTDGLTLFQRTGDEYFRIMGGWDVTASPGVTAREGMNKLTPVTNWRGYCSKYNYAVGTTDGGENAVTGYIFEKMNASDKKDVNDRGNSKGLNTLLYDFKAYKANFILGDYFVALGAGVTNAKPAMEEGIRTTIDQTAHIGAVTVIEKGKEKPLQEGRQSLITFEGQPVWVMQEGKFAYRVLPEFTRKAFVLTETCPTNWIKRNRGNAKKGDLPQTVDILRLWVDHGQAPVNDTYGYVVYTGKGRPADTLPFQVLRNDTLVQAVRSVDGKLVGVVFYPGNKGLEVDNLSLSASSPCVVLIQKEKGKYKLSVTDACMNSALKEITLVFNGRTVIVSMEQGMLSGKPSVIEIP